MEEADEEVKMDIDKEEEPTRSTGEPEKITPKDKPLNREGEGLGIQGAAVSSSTGQSFGNKNYNQVYAMIRQSMDETGLDRDSIFNQLSHASP